MSERRILLPGMDPSGARYNAARAEVMELLQQRGLTHEEQVGVLMICCVQGLRGLSEGVTRGRSEVIEAALSEFRRKLRRHL